MNNQSNSKCPRNNKQVRRPCLPPPQEAEPQHECECPQEQSNENCPCENHIRIEGKVSYRGQGIHLATVVIMRNRQVVAECLTDCDGCYEFKGPRANYTLRAHKNNRRSRARTISCNNKDRFEVNFNLM